MQPRIARPASSLSGTLRPPGDKSVSHRALILGALAVGPTRVGGLLESGDILRTADVLRALGAGIESEGGGRWKIAGRGVGGLGEPDQVLDFGNSGTGVRLMAGVLAGHDMTAVLAGDASLCDRPMGRVIEPLEEMGAVFLAREGGRLPMAVRGAREPMPIDYVLPVPSAQVKSAVLLAGLNTPGQTIVRESARSRDHTERMLRAFGARIETEADGSGQVIRLTGQDELQPCQIAVPADISSAAFPIVAALVSERSQVTVREVGINPLRAGLLETLDEMGADVTLENERDVAGEPVADILVRTSSLRGVTVPAERAPRMIDEYPVLAMAAACATGETRFEGVRELRAKESDRLSATAEGLRRCGVGVEESDDGLVIEGQGGPAPGTGDGICVETHMDHRIAMSFLVLGLASRTGVAIDDAAMIATSYPDFVEQLVGLGAEIA